MSRRKKTNLPGFLVVLMMLVSACGPALPVATPAPQAQQPAVADTPVQPTPDAPASEEGSAAVPPTPFPIKTALEATDPATVELASGGPLLVEFFAFW